MNFFHFQTFSFTILLATLFSADATISSSFLLNGKEWLTTNWNQQLQTIPINGGAVGPESLAFDIEGGGPYTGVSDGRIIKWLANESRWVDFAVTTPDREGCEGPFDHSLTEQRCGRTLGLSFNKKTGDLYIADAYKGLLKVSRNGGIAVSLVTEVQGVPLVFTNGLDIDQCTGIVYFTDSSTKYPERNLVSIFTTGEHTGRLIKFDPSTNEVTLLLNNLKLANGVSVAKNGQFLVVAETTNSRVLKYWLEPSKAGKVEVFAQLPGLPDNIQRNYKGEFWVGINISGQGLLNSTSSNSDNSVWAVKLSENGQIIEILREKNETSFEIISEVHERDGILWIGSAVLPFLAKLYI